MIILPYSLFCLCSFVGSVDCVTRFIVHVHFVLYLQCTCMTLSKDYVLVSPCSFTSMFVFLIFRYVCVGIPMYV